MLSFYKKFFLRQLLLLIPFLCLSFVSFAQPDPVPSSSTIACGPGTTVLTATGATGTQVYRWYFIDQATSLTILLLDNDAAGSFTTPTLEATTSFFVAIFDPGTGTESNRIAVKAIVEPDPLIDGPSVRGLCQGFADLTVDFATADSYQWERLVNNPDNTQSWQNATGSGNTSKTYRTTEPGFYRVRIIRNPGNCTTVTAAVEVREDNTPTAAINTTDVEFTCTENGNTTISAVPNSGTVNYQWLRDGNPITGATSINLVINAADVESNPGDFQIRVTSEDGACISTSAPVTISKVETPDASILDENNIDVTGQTLPFCAGESVSFTALSATAGATYTWFEQSDLTTPVGSGISFTASSAGTYVLRVSVIGCATDVQVTLDGSAAPIAQILDTSDVDAGDEIQVCRNETVSLKAAASGPGANYSWQTVSGFDPITLQPIFTEAPGGSSSTFTTPAITTDTRLRLVVTSGTCEVTDDIIIRVRDLFTVSVDGPTSICIGQPDITLNALIGGLPVGTFTFQWQENPGTGFVDIIGATAQTLAVSEADITASKTYRVIANNGCEETSAPFVVTKVNVEANINASATDVTLCDDGTSITTLSTPSDPAYSYQWSSSTNGTDFTDIAGATTDVLNINSSDLTVGNTVYRVTVSAGSCDVTDDITVIRQTPPTVTLDKAPTTIFCEGNTVDLSQTDALPGQTYQWFFSPSGAGGTYAPLSTETASTITINTEGFYQLQVTDGTCEVTSEPVFVDEVIDPVAAIIEGSTVIYCSNGATLTASPAGADTYLWEVFNTTTSSYEPASTSLSSNDQRQYQTNTPGRYRVTLTVSACGLASATSDPTEVIENLSGPTAQFITPGTIPFCGTSTTLTAIFNSGDNVTYELLFSTTETGTFNSVQGPQASNSFTVTDEGFYRVQVTNPDCNPTSNISDFVEVDRVNAPDPNPTNPEVSGGTVTICDGENIELTVAAGADLYEWFFSATESDDLADYTVAAGSSNTNTYSVSVTGFYRVRVTDNECTTATALGDKVKVEVVDGPNPNFTNPGLSGGGLINGCIGGTVTLAVAAGADNYEWFRATSSQTDIANYTLVTGANTESLVISQSEAGFYRVRVTDNNCTTTTAISPEVQVQFLDAPDPSFTNPGIISDVLSVCIGETATLTVAAGATTYEWFFSSTDSDDLVDYSPIAGAASIPSFSPTISGFYKVRVTNDNCTTSTAVSDKVQVSITTGPSATFTDPNISGGGIINSCIGGTVTLSVAPGADNYEWFRATSSQTDISGYASYPGSTESIVIPEADAGFFRVRVTDNNCTTSTSTSGEVQVQFLDAPDANYTTPGLTGSVITACTGENVVLSVAAGATDYEWLFSSTDSDIIGDYSPAPGATNSNSYSTSTAGFYRVRITNSACATATSIADKVEVRRVDAPDGTITNPDLIGGKISACNGQSIELTVPAGAESYVWGFSSSASGSFATAPSSSNSNIYTATQAGFYRVIVTDDNCLTTSTTSDIVELELTDGPSANILEVADIADNTIQFCNGSTTTLSVETLAGNTYQWQFSTAIDGTYSAATGTNNESTYEVTTAGFYRVSVTNSNCGSGELISDPVTIQVIDIPDTTIEEGTTTAFCPGGDVTLTVPQVVGNAYQWQFSTTSTGTYTDLAGQTANAITTSQVGFYRVVVTNADCSVATATSEPTEVREQEEPIVTINYFENSFFCPSDSTLLTSSFVAGGSGDITYRWLFSTTPNSGFSTAEGDNTNRNYFAKRTGFYKLSITASSCSIATGESAPLAVFEVGDIKAAIEPDPQTDFCSAEGVTLYGFSGIPIANTFKWLYSETQDGDYQVIGTNPDSIRVNKSGYYSVEITNTYCPNITPIDTAAAIYVEQRPLPRAEISQGDTTFFCIGSEAFISAEYNIGNTYTWEFSTTIEGNYTPFQGQGVTNSVLTTDQEGFYRAIVSNPSCPTSVNISEPIAVISTDGPPARILNPSVIDLCIGGSTTLQIDESIIGNSTYRWEYSETLNGTYQVVGSNAGFIASLAGFYRVIETNNACTTTSRQSQTIEIRQIQGPPARIEPEGQVLTICQGSSTVLNALAVEGANYQWLYSATENGTYSSIGINSISLSATQEGFYRVRVNSQECTPAANISGTVEVKFIAGPSLNLLSGTSLAFCEGGSVTLRGESTNTRDTFQWTFSNTRDGVYEAVSSIDSQKNTFTTSTPGFYKLVVSNADCQVGAVESDIIEVIQGEAPEAVIIEGSLLSFCSGDVLTLTAKEEINATYQWQFSETVNGTYTNVNGIVDQRSYEATQPGFYRVVVSRSGCGGGTVSESTELRATNEVNITIAANTQTQVFCKSGEISASVNTAGNFEFLWTLNGNALNETSSSITVTESGTYTVTLRNPPACYSGTPAETTVEIQSAPVIFLNTARTVSTCGEATLSAREESGVTYQWFLNNSPVGNESASITVSESGKYFLVAMNSAGCASTDSITYTNRVPQTQVVVSGENCEGVITVTSETGATYRLGETGNFQNEGKFTGLSVGTYTITVRSATGCQTTVEATVTELAEVTLTISENASIELDESIILEASGLVAYQWSPTETLDNSTIANPVATPIETTTYTVTGVDENGCSASASVTITVIDEFELIPNKVLTPNADGQNDTWIIKNIQRFPNAEVIVYDRWGIEVFRRRGYDNSWQGTAKANQLPEGVYYFVIELNNGNNPVTGTLNLFR